MEAELVEKRKKRAFGVGIFLYILIVLLLSFVSNTSVVKFFFGTLPILISLIAMILLIELEKYDALYFLIAPLVLAAGFYIVWQVKLFPPINSMDGPVVALINLFSMYVIYGAITLIWGRKKLPTYHHHHHPKEKEAETKVIVKRDDTALRQTHAEKEYYKNIAHQYYQLIESNKKEKQHYKNLANSYSLEIKNYIEELEKQKENLKEKQALEEEKDKESERNKLYKQKIFELNSRLKEAELALKVTKENFTTSLRGVEDKCKAINFVIGRVYSDKRGGSVEIRSILKINPILYNAFSEITTNFDEKYVASLTRILSLLQKKLSLYHLPEKEVFQISENPKIQSKRNEFTQNIILDVLVENDKDPIKEYHAEASEICNNLIRFLKENY